MAAPDAVMSCENNWDLKCKSPFQQQTSLANYWLSGSSFTCMVSVLHCSRRSENFFLIWRSFHLLKIVSRTYVNAFITMTTLYNQILLVFVLDCFHLLCPLWNPSLTKKCPQANLSSISSHDKLHFCQVEFVSQLCLSWAKVMELYKYFKVLCAAATAPSSPRKGKPQRGLHLTPED